MSIAVVQGSSSGIGLNFARLLLTNTKLNVVATSRNPSEARKKILDGLDVPKDRLLTLEVDTAKEDSLAAAASETQKTFGKESLRLLLNVSGIVRLSSQPDGLQLTVRTAACREEVGPDCLPGARLRRRSITKVNLEEVLETYRVNTISHLLTYKHFVPLLPSKKDGHDNDEAASPYVQPGLSVLASLSARVGSIGDNEGQLDSLLEPSC